MPPIPDVSNPMPRKRRVLLVDDHPLVRHALKQLFATLDDFEVVAEAVDGRIALETVRTTLPDLIVMDLNLPALNGVMATRAIHDEFPQVHILGLSLADKRYGEAAMLRAGAYAFVAKDGPADELLAAINACPR